MSIAYKPVFEVTRGGIVESLHYGAAVVVDSYGRVLSWVGDPQIVTFMRSSAKPIQALPFIETGGDQYFHLTSRELAIICGSHDGSDEHLSVIKSLQEKVGVKEDDLLCGVHPPIDGATANQLLVRGESLTPNRHNCSGKHTAMLAYATMLGKSSANYVDFDHPVQHNILSALAEISDLPVSRIVVGRDGCSAPAFALPLYNAALCYARLSDPHALSPERAGACRRITSAMLTNPEMVAGTKRFDTRLMKVGGKRIISKGGAEGFLSIGVLPGVISVDSPGIGIAIKVSDGDSLNRVRPALAMEILKQTNILSEKDLNALKDFAPLLEVKNWRNIVVGESRTIFTLQKAG